MFLIRNPVQRYAWGSPTALADLLGLPSDGGPQAELWLGANAAAPSVRATDGVPLPDVIREDPVGMLGPRVAGRYGDLPFLLKVLAAAEPLSIQAHPSSSQAEE
ncbi:MAG: mannose-6-phosphate isomerase, class I, partial [Actinobacteria bacterium ATB1]|nr:mannose-6-phosphate isomerase, class I [Actinobacteria bacterium ATB1]